MDYLKITILPLLLALIVVSCGTDKKHFKLEGRLLNINQGQFIVYSPDGAMSGTDTLKVVGGRFEMLGECLKEGTVVLMMPNGSQVPVFVEPGASLELNGNAQNLDMVEVKGTKANEVMNEFRKASSGQPDSKIPGIVLDVVKKNPGEITGIYLIRNYLLPRNDYDDAAKLVDIMLEKQKDNATLTAMRSQLKEMSNVQVGKGVPAFFATTVDSVEVSADDLRKGVAVVVCWASWAPETTSLINRLFDIKASDGTQPKILGISLDAAIDRAEKAINVGERDVKWYNTCDGKLVDGHLAHLFSVSQVPTVIIIKDGKIIERTSSADAAVDKVRKLFDENEFNENEN